MLTQNHSSWNKTHTCTHSAIMKHLFSFEKCKESNPFFVCLILIHNYSPYLDKTDLQQESFMKSLKVQLNVVQDHVTSETSRHDQWDQHRLVYTCSWSLQTIWWIVASKRKYDIYTVVTDINNIYQIEFCIKYLKNILLWRHNAMIKGKGVIKKKISLSWKKI